MSELTSIIEILRRRAEVSPNLVAFSFLKDGEGPEVSLTYGELDEQARRIAASIRTINKNDSPVIILCLPGLEYVSALFGSFYAGTFAVPAYPPWFNRDLSRLLTIIEDSQAAVGISSTSVLKRVQSKFGATAALQKLSWINIDTVTDDEPREAEELKIGADHIAYLQYTSGSISTPKGVKVRHDNILHNLKYIDREFKHSDESVAVSWLPPFHDMGLIYGILQPVYSGFHCVLMSPLAFVQAPIRWLRAISRYQATHSGGPNFAYEHCIRRITDEQTASLDLKSWRVAFTGAEIIRSETLERFARKFESTGFRWESFSPAYGLAEATLKVSCCPVGKPPTVVTFDAVGLEQNRAIEISPGQRDGRELVGCGCPGPELKVVIMDPSLGAECEPGRVGEVWVSGPSITAGYWRRPEETELLFNNRLEGINDVSFLRTGDLGFFHQGELFVTGRLKELIIIRGQNHYPHDIERTAQRCHPAMSSCLGAAFSIDAANEEKLVILQEIAPIQTAFDPQQLILAIYNAVAENYELSAYAVCLVKRGTLSKTSSGKIQRHECRAKFLNNSLELLASRTFEPSNGPFAEAIPDRVTLLAMEADERLAQIRLLLRKKTAYLLRKAPQEIDMEAPFVHLGLDSLTATDLINWVSDALRVSIGLNSLLGDFSIINLSHAILDQLLHLPTPAPGNTGLESGGPVNSIFRGHNSATPDYPLSFEQERLWFLSQVEKASPASNISGAVRIIGKVNVPTLERALNDIVRRHSVLRTVIVNKGGYPVQNILPELRLKSLQICLQELNKSRQEPELPELMRLLAQRPFDLTRGPLIRTALVALSEDSAVFLIVVHHIVFDARSFTILTRELATLYASHIRSEPGPLPDIPFQYADFVMRQRDWLDEKILAPHISHWKSRLENLPQPFSPSSCKPDIHGCRSKYLSFEIPQEELQPIINLGRTEKCTAFMTLLTGFKILLCMVTKQEDLVVGSPISGRFHPDLNDLIGFFAYPVVFRTDVSGDPSFTTMLRKVRNVVLDTYEHMHVPFAWVVRAANPKRYKNSTPLFQVMFNFLKMEETAKSEAAGLTMELTTLGSGPEVFDLVMTLIDTPVGIQGEIGYRTSLFDSTSVRILSQYYCDILKQCAAAPNVRLSELVLPKELESIYHSEGRINPGSIVVSSTFTADQLQEALIYWGRYLGTPCAIEFTPYNQMFQQLLDSTSRLSNPSNIANILLIRFEDWSEIGEEREEKGQFRQAERRKLENIVTDLLSALETAVRYSSTPYILVICPSSPRLNQNPDWEGCSRRIEQILVSEVEKSPQLHIITTEYLARLYPVSNYYDPYTDKLARIPYTPVFFTALGTAIARKLHAINNNRRKVLVLDCDGTLWKGVCAEDGPHGIEIDQSCHAVQQFMVDQHDAGMLLCLCSKNKEEDVFAVFDAHPEMPLRREHFVAWRINWMSKSENLKSLADELGLSPDSFLFLDDNPVECAEVKANCPGPLVLCLPNKADRIPSFLDHVWAFDNVKITTEDRQRTKFYREMSLRAQSLNGSMSLQDFLKTLELNVLIHDMSGDQVQRVAQLTQRTNQFNVSPARYSAADISRMWQSANRRILTVNVDDRFGDYGLVGVIIYAVESDCLDVDTFLISCRALGKGVEKIMLSRIIEEADRIGCKEVKISFVRTDRNQPAYIFLEEVGADYKEPNGMGWTFRFPVCYRAGHDAAQI